MDEAMRVVQLVVRSIQATGALVGVHCCAFLPDSVPPVALLCRTGADVVSCDAYRRLASWCADSDVCAFVEKGGILAPGLVPTVLDLSRVSSADLLTDWISAIASRGRQVDVACHTLVTATCGLGLLSEDAARQSFRLARDVAGLIGRVHSLGANGQHERSPR